MNSSLKRTLVIGYAISLLLLVISSVASYKSIQNLLYSQNTVNHTNTVINKLEDVVSVLKDAETGQRGYLLSNDEQFLEPYNGSLDKADRIIDDIKSLTSDNLSQQESLEQLRILIRKRISTLQILINNKQRGISPTYEQLISGKSYMDEARRLVTTMETREQALLINRTNQLNKFAASTPVLIIVASILAFIVTILSFVKVNRDLEKRLQLQKRLQEKDNETSKRLTIIKGITEKISSGNYKTRVSDEGKDVLGSLAGLLNKMADSLDVSFENLSSNEWLQKGIAELNKKMIGETNLDKLTYNVIEFLTSYIDASLSAFYLVNNNNQLVLSGSVSLNRNEIQNINIGDGIAGQCAASRKQVLITNISETDIFINYSAGSIKPKTILAIPVCYETKLKGVIEFGFLNDIKPAVEEILKTAAINIGMAIHSAKDHQRLQQLLNETQSQSEELQAQHSELENINAELEVQTEKLQASDEELRVQQEELQQANQELEERSRLLEEKNELIMERNLEVQSKAKELELSTKYKSEFLANMSHELRTPLNSILLLSRLLSENHNNSLSKEQVEYANVIQNSGNGLLTLINEILDLSKIEAGKMELDFIVFSIQELINELKSLFDIIAKDRNINFNIHVENNTAEKVETDRLRLEQILRNLISNALKFTKRGFVTLNVKSDSSTISFSVKDTGIGIPYEKQQTIFEAFQQADGSTRREFGGTGLGLSISRELAKLLGGEISISSEEGKGSEFTLILPLNKGVPYQLQNTEAVVLHTAPIIDNKKAEFIADTIPAVIPDDRNDINKDDKVILIIEDDTSFAKSLLEFTRKNNYKAVVAVRGDEGVEFAAKFHPVGILLDIQLPVKNGWDVMTELKANPLTRSIPVHIMSSYEVKKKSLSAGAIDFIHKPAVLDKMSEIFNKIETALSRHPKKVFIIEENIKHAQALGYFLETNNVVSEIKNAVSESIEALNNKNTDCVILDTGFRTQELNDTLAEMKKTGAFEDIPVIVFTGRSLSNAEEMRIKQYADSIVIKTAHSYQRILDEVSLFLHLVEKEGKRENKTFRYKQAGGLTEVLKNKSVLIADDDVRNIFSLTKSLEQYGMHITSAMDGNEALKQLDDNKIDIVLMDMMMPEMDGYESIKHIRANKKYLNLPVIAVTAKAMQGDREKCISAGASDYITKPVDVDQLTSLLRVWLYEA